MRVLQAYIYIYHPGQNKQDFSFGWALVVGYEHDYKMITLGVKKGVKV
tara:strand:- start:30 stop:173 length:144 start_codon:yes stop_codon:yes gene_type:complete